MIIYKVEYHEDYGRHVFRVILSGTNSNIDRLIERTEDYWHTGIELLEGDINQNDEEYNNMLVEEECTKTYPKADNFFALTTCLSKLD